MCLCCIVHCDGSCNLQPGRVVKNGKSCYAGHCNTSAQCVAKLSLADKQQAIIEFNKRCIDMQNKKSENNVSEDIASENDEPEDYRSGNDIMVWYTVYCDMCEITMNTLYGNYFYHGLDNDYCIPCFEKIMGNNNCHRYTKWSSTHTDPYGGSPAKRLPYIDAVDSFMFENGH
jgi:hypothetical protein